MDSDRASRGFIRWFGDVGLADLAEVGGKNASLGELVRALAQQGICVPDGFAITAAGYRHMLDRAGCGPALRRALDGLDPDDMADLGTRARAAREIVRAAPMPEDLAAEILAAHDILVGTARKPALLAVRSSATAEDLPGASFAGLHESFLDVEGGAALLEAVRNCYVSLFNERAIRYRANGGFDHFQVALSVGVMHMVRADDGASGVVFTIDTDTGFRDAVLLTGAWGLGEPVVQGTVDPDEFHVFKPTLRAGHRVVLRRRLGEKAIRMVRAPAGAAERTRTEPTPAALAGRFCVSDAEVLQLAEAAVRIEEHYSRVAGQPTPMDIEWARDGVDGRLYVLQARPETVASRRPTGVLEEIRLGPHGTPLVSGRAVGTRVASGTARVVTSLADLAGFRPGEVLVAVATLPDWSAVMAQAAAIVTDRGGRTCHAAILAREAGVPAVVGCDRATALIQTGDMVTVSCAEGTVGHVYGGRVAVEVTRVETASLPRPRTQVMLNLGNPDLALQAGLLPCDGVGLARMEFIIAEHIGVHPMALVHPERVEDAEVRERILARARLDASPQDFFVRELSEGVGTIAAAFHPRPVIVRLSDFKSNEYASLLGGRWFEPVEANPMLGFRGAARYAHPAYAEGFALECAALRRVREAMGLRNLEVMVPFCRRVDEAQRVLAAMAEHGLQRGEGGLKVHVMCEIPNNVIQADAFARLFDGFSIGSNDLTQLVLGVDRDSALMAFAFDEGDPGVRSMIAQAVQGAHRNGRHVGLCGQSPSDDPEMAAFLVGLGIDSISVTPDALLAVTRRVLAAEDALR